MFCSLNVRKDIMIHKHLLDVWRKWKKRRRTQPQFEINGKLFWFLLYLGYPPISTGWGRMKIVFSFYLYISYSWKETTINLTLQNSKNNIFQSSRYIHESNKLEMVIYLPKIQVMSSSLYHYDSDRRVRCLCYL